MSFTASATAMRTRSERLMPTAPAAWSRPASASGCIQIVTGRPELVLASALTDTRFAHAASGKTVCDFRVQLRLMARVGGGTGALLVRGLDRDGAEGSGSGSGVPRRRHRGVPRRARCDRVEGLAAALGRVRTTAAAARAARAPGAGAGRRAQADAR